MPSFQSDSLEYFDESEADDYMYRGYCLELDGDTDLSGTPMRVEVCEDSDDADNYDYDEQRWKYGYDWVLGEYTGSEQIVLAEGPWWCLDVQREDSDDDNVAGGATLNETTTPVYMYECDSSRMSQKWVFDETTGEVKNRGTKLCLAWYGNLVNGRLAYLMECDGSYKWDPRFFSGYNVSTPTHGSFYFDPYRNVYDRGAVQPQAVQNLTKTKNAFKFVSSVPASKSFYDYTVWNTSVMTVVVAGNSTLEINTDPCPLEGCEASGIKGRGPALFYWSDNASWVANNESVPCDWDVWSYGETCADVTIWDEWVVILDVETPFLNTLNIRGKLVADNDANDTIGIHSNLIDIRGGTLEIGNETAPFEGPYAHITMHGDMYAHGKECTRPIEDTDEGCWKKIKVNGDLKLHGKNVNSTRTLVADAAAGTNALVVESPVFEWTASTWHQAGSTGVAGAELVISGSDAGGQPEYHTIDYISPDGLTIYLVDDLASGKIGTTVDVVDSDANLDVTIDGRATVSLLSRNIEFLGGYDLTYDYISGVGPDLTDYGATIRVFEAFSEDKAGWAAGMAGYELYGQYFYPEGTVSALKYVRFRGAGKQFDMWDALVREPVLVLLPGMEVTVQGCSLTEPLTGSFFGCQNAASVFGAASQCAVDKVDLTILDNVLVGTSMQLEPSEYNSHVVRNNLFFGGWECRQGCPPQRILMLGGSGTLDVRDNIVYGGFGGYYLRADCSQYVAWENNVAIGNAVGYDVQAGCTSLKLLPYRNSAGVTVGTSKIANVIAAENGMAIVPAKWKTKPDEKPNLPGDVLTTSTALDLVENSTIIGRTPDDGSGDVRSSNCDIWSGGGDNWHDGFKVGGSLTGFRHYDEYAYSGFAYSGPYNQKRGSEYGGVFDGFHYSVERVNFYGFSGVDSCGRSNVAISNEMAGDGEGSTWVGGAAHWAKSTCYPVVIRKSSFSATPTYARLRFSKGPSDQTYEVGWALCTVYDDGSLLGRTPEPASVNSQGLYQLVAAHRHEWPEEVLTDCTSWEELGYTDEEVGSGSVRWSFDFDALQPSFYDPRE